MPRRKSRFDPTKHQEIISAIFQEFPNSRILSETEKTLLYLQNPSLSARAVSCRETRRADKKKEKEEKKWNYELFDMGPSCGGI